MDGCCERITALLCQDGQSSPRSLAKLLEKTGFDSLVPVDDVDALFVGKTARSATGKLRKLWREHLDVDDVELRTLCTHLGFNLTRDSLDAVRGMLDDVCRSNGL